MQDIFQDDSAIPETNWMKFEKIGDSIQGVLIDEPQYNQPSKFGEQNVYTIETEDQRVVMVALKPTSNKRAVAQLKTAVIGDIIGFKFTSEYDSGKGNPGKNIEVRIKKVQVGGGFAPSPSPTPVSPNLPPQPQPTQSSPTPVLDEKEQKVEKILDLAVLKLGCSRSEARLKIMEVTGMALSDSNIDAIYAAMMMLK